MESVRVIYAEMLSRGPEHFPFSAAPEWLVNAIAAKDIALSSRGARDYAVMDINTQAGIKEAVPGDSIVYDNGKLDVEKEKG